MYAAFGNELDLQLLNSIDCIDDWMTRAVFQDELKSREISKVYTEANHLELTSEKYEDKTS